MYKKYLHIHLICSAIIFLISCGEIEKNPFVNKTYLLEKITGDTLNNRNFVVSFNFIDENLVLLKKADKSMVMGKWKVMDNGESVLIEILTSNGKSTLEVSGFEHYHEIYVFLGSDDFGKDSFKDNFYYCAACTDLQ